MDWWFLRNPERLAVERQAIRELEERADWLEGTEWVLEKALALNAAIKVHGHVYCVKLTYPAHFPFAPPVVRPAEAGVRWSSHQYPDGTLCLEWGPDTWHPDVTAAQVLTNVFRLLEIENPLGAGNRAIAPSRHALSQGQSLRSSYGRVYAEASFYEFLATLPEGTTGVLDLSFQFQRESYTVLVQEARLGGTQVWNDTAIPADVRGTQENFRLAHGLFVLASLAGVELRGVEDVAAIEAAFWSAGHREAGLVQSDAHRTVGLEQPPELLLLVDRERTPHFFALFGSDEGEAHRLAIVRSAPSAGASRVPVDLEGLAEKKVGVVGLGSLGAKVALSLLRMGVRRFMLVDDDVFLPENVCRHPLDWRYVGQHKVDAVAEAMERAAAGVEVQVSRLNLTGQENTASLNGVLKRLGKCDVLLDMTASAEVFNLLSAVAGVEAKPLVWAEVFAGGIGGLVGRSRPRKDPPPQVMRAALAEFSERHPAPELPVTEGYGVTDEEGHVWSASDADVGVIAAHAAGIAADTVLAREPSAYPHSLYLVGLVRAWVFEAPFHTIPIATDHLVRPEKAKEGSGKEVRELAEFLTDLLRKNRGADSSS